MNNEIINNEKINYQKALVFLKEKTFVHICKINGAFYNGLLFKVTKDYIVIHDREEGKKKIFFFEIKGNIDEYKEVKNESRKNT